MTGFKTTPTWPASTSGPTEPETRSPPPAKPNAESTSGIADGTEAETLVAQAPANVRPAPSPKEFSQSLLGKLRRVVARNGKVYLAMQDAGNSYAVLLGSRKADNIIRKLARQSGVTLRKAEVLELNEILHADAEMAGLVTDVWYRVARIASGIEIDLGDENHARVRIMAGKVEVVSEGSETLFQRSAISQPMVMPAAAGDIRLLDKYVNLSAADRVLLVAWISYTLTHPKEETSKYVILILRGNQGSGKSFLCRIIQTLIDPGRVGVQLFPRNGEDLAIAAQNAHVLFYDNIRDLKPYMADILCIASTGGDMSKRQMYTDAEQQVIRLHGAMVLNGIYSFIDQPDLAQRCLPLELPPLGEGNRKSEMELARAFQMDLPSIQRGLFNLIAEVFRHLPTAKVVQPERMYDFSQWLAAMEMVDGAPEGIYQSLYSEAIEQGQRDSLLDNPLAAAVLEFAETLKEGEWSGTPASFLRALNSVATPGTYRPSDWPQNPIQISKRLGPLQASLLTQGVRVEFGRGKNRTITLTREEKHS